MITVIPMAGRSQRFKEAGYAGHKAMLPMPDGRPMLAWLLASLPDPDCLILVANREDAPPIRHYLAEAAWPLAMVVALDERTAGPLDTILRAGIVPAEQDDELLIHYCDCWLANSHYFLRRARMDRGRPAMAVFDDENGRYQRSRFGRAIGGVFWFPSTIEFVAKGRQLALDDQTGAPQVAALFEATAEINVTGLYTDLGTPADYEAYFRKRGLTAEGAKDAERKMEGDGG